MRFLSTFDLAHFIDDIRLTHYHWHMVPGG